MPLIKSIGEIKMEIINGALSDLKILTRRQCSTHYNKPILFMLITEEEYSEMKIHNPTIK